MEWIPIKKNIDYAIFMGLRTFIYILEVDPPESICFILVENFLEVEFEFESFHSQKYEINMVYTPCVEFLCFSKIYLLIRVHNLSPSCETQKQNIRKLSWDGSKRDQLFLEHPHVLPSLPFFVGKTWTLPLFGRVKKTQPLL